MPLGMRASRRMVESLFREVTGGTVVAFGKPQMGMFEFATRLPREWRKDEYGVDEPSETVYFIENTPKSDIRNMNEFNDESRNDWFSILVKSKTGLW